VAAFAPLLSLLADVPDPRRPQGQLYKLPHLLLFSILAIVTGCNSYRSIVTFIDVHRRRLNAAFGLNWRRAPAHTAVRYILKGLDPAAVCVELYADGATPERHEMERVGPHTYRAQAPASRGVSDYTARVIPRYPGVPVPLQSSEILWQR